MKDQEYTRDCTRKICSQILCSWSIRQEEGFAIRWKVIEDDLQIQVLSERSFTYYYGMFKIQTSFNHTKIDSEQIPQEVLSALQGKFQNFYFKNDELSLECYENHSNRYRKRYIFPTLNKVHLNVDIFDQYRRIQQLQKQLILTKHKVRDAEISKSNIFTEFKNLQSKVNQEKRQKERAKEKQGEKRWFNKHLLWSITETTNKIKCLVNAICQIKGDTAIFFIFLSILCWFLFNP